MLAQDIQRGGILVAVWLTGAAAAHAQTTTLYSSKSTFLSALTTPTTVDFDTVPRDTVLSVNQFETMGVLIKNLDGHPIHVGSWLAGGNLEIPSAPNVISSSYASTPAPGFAAACCGIYFNDAASDLIQFAFTTPASAAGIHIGENDLRGVRLIWYDIDGNVIRSETFPPFAPGNGFIGLVSPDVPIAALVVENRANDGDGMFFDDLVFEPACLMSPPIISRAAVEKSLLWPPDHALVPLNVGYSVAGSCGARVSCSLRGSSSEPDNGLGDGDLPGDVAVIDPNTIALRAERSGTGSGRQYSVEIVCTDDVGNTSTQPLKVTVPHGIRRGGQ